MSSIGCIEFSNGSVKLSFFPVSLVSITIKTQHFLFHVVHFVHIFSAQSKNVHVNICKQKEKNRYRP